MRCLSHGFAFESDCCWEAEVMRRRCWSCVRKLRSETSEAKTRQDLLEPSARKTTMQFVFQKRHPAVKRWKKQKGRSDRSVERHGRERTCRCARRSILVSLCKNLPAGFCRLVFIDCGGEMANLSSALFLFCFHPILCVVIVQGRMWWTVVLG